MDRSVEDEVASVVRGFLPQGVSFTQESNLFSELGFKSSSALHLIMELESRLAISVSDSEFAKVRTVADLTRLAERARTGAAR
jgi:acyl carrier protein